MASGLNIHIDKENATPSFVPNKGVKGILTQSTQRKALFDVNKDTTQLTPSRGTWNDGFLKPSADRHQPVLKKSSTASANKSGPPKKMSLQENKIFQRKGANTSQHPTSAKASKSKKKVPKKPDPIPDDEDGYDSDTIWPKAERLSTHIHSIFTWRPSCLAANDYESDSDGNLSEEEIPDQIIMERPATYDSFMEMPEIDLDSILASLPDPEKP